MHYLNQILSDEDIEEILDTFDHDALNRLDDENVYQIICFLEQEGIDYILDILHMYLDLFLIDAHDFVYRFQKLKRKYPHLKEYMAEHMDVLEEMWF